MRNYTNKMYLLQIKGDKSSFNKFLTANKTLYKQDQSNKITINFDGTCNCIIYYTYLLQ